MARPSAYTFRSCILAISTLLVIGSFRVTPAFSQDAPSTETPKAIFERSLASAESIARGHVVIEGALEYRSGSSSDAPAVANPPTRVHRFRYEVWADFIEEKFRWDFSRTHRIDLDIKGPEPKVDDFGDIRTIIWRPDLAVNTIAPYTLYVAPPKMVHKWGSAIKAFDLRTIPFRRPIDWNTETHTTSDERIVTVQQRYNIDGHLKLNPVSEENGNLLSVIMNSPESNLKIVHTFDRDRSYSLVASRMYMLRNMREHHLSDREYKLVSGIYVPITVHTRTHSPVFSPLEALWEHVTLSLSWQSVNEPIPSDTFEYENVEWIRKTLSEGNQTIRLYDSRYTPEKQTELGGDERRQRAEVALTERVRQKEDQSESSLLIVVVLAAAIAGAVVAWFVTPRRKQVAR
jgi:hypothetical protein